MTMTVKNHNGINSDIKFVEDGETKRIVYGVYAPTHDMTFIMEDILADGKIISTEVIGFCFSNEVENLDYILERSKSRKLKAEFEGGL